MTIAPPLLDKLAWIGIDYVKLPIRGIVLRFSGLGTTGMKTAPEPAELEWGEAGALVVVPYHDPWGWANIPMLTFVDELVAGLRAQYKLDAKVPLISTGGSMGGHAALTYAMKSRHEIAACLAIFPVCDLPFHYTERPDLPRTMHHAYGYGEIEERLRTHSPLHQVESMRRMPYLIVHGDLDQAVAKKAHSDKLVAAMRKRELEVEYLECPKLGHGGPFTHAEHRRIVDFVLGRLR